MLCLAGRGPLDEAASAMLAQLLQKHGLGARVLPFDAASRAHIGLVDFRGTAMVCISYLEISGSPANLRYLVRRLRNRLPDAPILVGLWPDEDEILHDDRQRAIIGANHYTSTLHEAVEACLAEARKASAATAARAPGRGGLGIGDHPEAESVKIRSPWFGRTRLSAPRW